MKIDADKIKRFIFGESERVEEDTPTGYRSFTKQTEPNVLQRIIESLRDRFDPGYMSELHSPYQAQPTPTPGEQYDTSSFTQQEQYNNIPTPTATPTPPPLPTPGNTKLNDVIKQTFGDEYWNAIATLQGENASFDPMAKNTNNDGSEDRGIFQINSNTFSDFALRKGQILRKIGIKNYDDMYDPIKNTMMAKLIFDEQGWDAWYGAPEELRGGDKKNAQVQR